MEITPKSPDVNLETQPDIKVVCNSQKREMKTLRSQCFAIGAWTANHARKKVLKLSLTRSKRPWMDEIRARIYEFKAPFLISTA